MERYDVAIIGAGKTGRGFIGRLLQESGLHFLLIDKDPVLVDRLKTAGHFHIGFFGDVRSPLRIEGFGAMHTEDPAIADALSQTRLIFLSVGGSHITEAATWLAGVGLHRNIAIERTVILCENADRPAEKSRRAFLAALDESDREKADSLFGFSEATVFCTTIEDRSSPLDIRSEDYPYLQCDAKPLKSGLPDMKALVRIPVFGDFLIRKIHTYNAASAAISYLGWWKGHTLYSDGANDPYVLSVLDRLYAEVGKAMCAEYGYTEEEQREFAARSLVKFRDRTIADTISRNAREPHRKLAKTERIIGPALLIEKHGGDFDTLALTAAAALLYKDPEDIEWTCLQRELGPVGILERVCGLDPVSPLAIRILEQYSELEKETYPPHLPSHQNPS